MTQREILESWLPILGVVATGITGILRLIALFHRSPVPALEDS